MQRRYLAALVAALTLIALPATAEDCASYTIGRVGNTSHITGRQDVAGVQVNLEGHYLWVNLGEPADPVHPEQDVDASHNVAPDVTGATVCPDGSVSFTTAPAPVVEFDPMPVLIVADVEPVPIFDLEAFAGYMAGQPGVWG